MKANKWNLELLYKGDKDPRIEQDIKNTENLYAQFEKKYKGKDFTATIQKLKKALQEYEKLNENTTPKAWWYFALRTDLDGTDKIAGAAATHIEQRLNIASNRVTFFPLEIGKITKQKQKEFLTSEELKPYRYFLERIFQKSKHFLSEKEEQLSSLLSQTSYTMWVDGQQRVLSQETIDFKGEVLPIAKAISMISDLPKKDRNELNEKINEVFIKCSSFAEAEINAVYNYKKIMDTLRGYKKPYSHSIVSNENDEKTVEDLVAMVTNYFTLSHKFYDLHAKLLKEKKLNTTDRLVKIGEIKRKFTYESAIEIVKKSFTKVDKKYADVLDSFIKNGQLDVFPVKGKKGGAYCWGMGNFPTFVLLNHTDNIRSVEILAHEMGHAIHTEFSKSQPALYKKYTTSCAEVASTFFEQVVIEDLMEQLNDNEKIILLHNKILGDIGTVFRQIACFNFEVELHEQIRKEGQLGKDKIAVLLQKHIKSYVGKSMEVVKNDGYYFVTWSHIRRFFYVYTYAYGQLISRALYEKWKIDPSYEKKIATFLSAGRSMSPKDIFAKIGIKTDKSFFEAGLKGIENDIKSLERLAKKLKRI